MANRALFHTRGPAADTRNEAGGLAYRMSPRHALAQYAVTGCLNGTYYADDREQLQTVLALCGQVEPEFIAKTALYARERGYMKDMPALLAAVLSVRGPAWLARVFDRVIDNGRMVRNFVQILRSGAVGRRSLGTRPKRLVQGWLNGADDTRLVQALVGQSPSLADVVKMVHPCPVTPEREALFGYIIGRPHEESRLPEPLRAFEAYKRGESSAFGRVPFQLLTGLPMGREQWSAVARQASWQQTRMNLNTFARHGVFEEQGLTELIAARLADPREVAMARAFPYQLLAAWSNLDAQVPGPVKRALAEAMEQAIAQVPKFPGKVYLLPDVSGSMSSPVTGQRGGGTTAMRCIDVAALVAAAVRRKNPSAEILPFDTRVHATGKLPPQVLEAAARLAKFGGGGTDCSLPLAELNRRGAEGDLVIYVSDNESWVDNRHAGATATMREWDKFRRRNRSARLVCIDIQPYATTQAQERADILNVGGFSDAVFELIARFAEGKLGGDHWVEVIEAVAIG